MNDKIWVIQSPSAFSYRMCTLGAGPTENEAWLDAFGPKPWTPTQKRASRKAQAVQMTEAEYEEVQFMES